VVETDDFRQVMEEHSGRSLVKFFDQWFHSPGYPDIKVTFKYDSKQNQGIFEVEQKQVDLEEGIPVFELKTALGWTIEGEYHRLPIKLEEERHSFVVTMAAEPEAVRFDPDYQVLHKLSFNPGDPKLRHQLVNAKDVIGRILAAHELAKSGSRTNILAIVEAYAAEPFWGAREEFAQALAKAGTEVSIDGLAQIVASEQDPMVLPAVFRAAGQFRDARLRDAIGERLQGELAPIARQVAFLAMGKQRELAQWDLLLEGSRQPGYNGLAQSGAFGGLAATRREEATRRLIEQIPYGVHSNRVRPAIVSGLADIAKGLEKANREQVVELLSDLLRDPWRLVRFRAAAGLTQMRATEAIPALEAFSHAQSQQGQVYFEKMIERLKTADKSDGSAIKKQVEDLQTKLRKLEGQVQTLQAKVEAEDNEAD
jgi:aminopeptidase N